MIPDHKRPHSPRPAPPAHETWASLNPDSQSCATRVLRSLRLLFDSNKKNRQSLAIALRNSEKEIAKLLKTHTKEAKNLSAVLRWGIFDQDTTVRNHLLHFIPSLEKNGSYLYPSLFFHLSDSNPETAIIAAEGVVSLRPKNTNTAFVALASLASRFQERGLLEERDLVVEIIKQELSERTGDRLEQALNRFFHTADAHSSPYPEFFCWSKLPKELPVRKKVTLAVKALSQPYVSTETFQQSISLIGQHPELLSTADSPALFATLGGVQTVGQAISLMETLEKMGHEASELIPALIAIRDGHIDLLQRNSRPTKYGERKAWENFQTLDIRESNEPAKDLRAYKNAQTLNILKGNEPAKDLRAYENDSRVQVREAAAAAVRRIFEKYKTLIRRGGTRSDHPLSPAAQHSHLAFVEGRI